MTKAGLVFFPGAIERVVESARLMERLGYDALGLIDSHALALDVYVALAAAALHTGSLRLGPCVTNPVTRDLTVTAGAIASVDALSNGRAFLGLSRGFSSARAVGLAPAATSAMAGAVRQLRALLGGETAELGARRARLPWIRRPVPIMLAASGPMGLRIGGQVADAVLVHLGVSPAIVAGAVAAVHAGAREAGRQPGDVEIWVFGAASCADDAASAREAVLGTVAGMGASVFAPSSRGKHLPAALEEPVLRLRQEYRVSGHMQVGDDHNVRLIERLGLADYLVDRFALAGTPADVRARVRALRDVGVDRLMLNVSTSRHLERDIRTLAGALDLAPAR